MAFAAADSAFGDVVGQLLTYAATLPNMVAAITQPTEQKFDASRFPFAVAVCRSANPKLEAAAMTTLATFGVQIHTSPFQVLQTDWTAAMPYGVAYARTLWNNPTLNKLVSTIVDMRVRYGTLEFPQGTLTLGWDFEIDAKLLISLA